MTVPCQIYPEIKKNISNFIKTKKKYLEKTQSMSQPGKEEENPKKTLARVVMIAQIRSVDLYGI